MIQRKQVNLSLGILSALCLTIMPGIVHAQIVTSTVTLLSGGVYHYDYGIANNTGDDLFNVSIHVLPNSQLGVDTVFNVTAPIGFKGSYTDSVNGLVDYTEDTDIFTTTLLNGFTYDSFIAPQASAYDATRFGAGGSVTTTDATIAAVPEPGSMVLFASLGVITGFAARRKRRK